MGIIYGLIAALGWGLGDYLITHLTRRVGTPRGMVYAQTMSLLAWCGLLLVQPAVLLPQVPQPLSVAEAAGAPLGGINIWAVVFISGICHVLGLVLSYRAFEIGTLSLVSPIASGFAVVTAVLALVSGERPAASALAGAALLFIGVVSATRAPAGTEKTTLAGVPHALGCAVTFGVMFWMFGFIEPKLGVIWPLLVLKTMAAGSALLSLTSSRVKRVPDPPAAVIGATAPHRVETGAAAMSVVWPLALGVAVTDTGAWIAFIFGTRTEFTMIVTALASLFSVVTILLAWALLRERLAPNQWVGVAIILLGVLMVSM